MSEQDSTRSFQYKLQSEAAGIEVEETHPNAMDYLVSDLHLDHDNIIDYCDRPFSSVEEMNETLVEQWNAVVDPDDEVLYGGDLTIRTSAAALLDWLDEFNGEIVFLLVDILPALRARIPSWDSTPFVCSRRHPDRDHRGGSAVVCEECVGPPEVAWYA